MRLSLITRVILAFCLVALAATALLWTHIAMQKRIMARYHATQAIDIASLRDLTQARRTVADFRNDLLQEKPEDLVQSLRLSARFSPAQRQLQAFLRAVEAREPAQETFSERAEQHDALKIPFESAGEQIEQLPQHTRALLQEIDRTHPDEQRVQQKLGVLLVSLDHIETQIRTLHHILSTRHHASIEKLSRDQQRASRMSALLLIFAFFSFALAVLTVWRALSPIQRLTSAASKVGQGDFDVERIRAANDEIGQLAEAFHTMTQGLAARDRAVSTANQEREHAYQKLLREEQARIQAERLAVIGELSARITHELRNPLSSLSLNMEMILEDPKLDELDDDTHEMLRSMTREIQRLEALSTGYLSLARKPVGMHERLSLTSLTRSILTQFQRSAELDEITLLSAFEDELWIEGDENELRGVLINLIENARIAVAHEPPPRTIRIEGIRDADHVVWTIQDNGPGVSASMLEHLFDPFMSDRPEGTGLGLSTARRIVETHYGTLLYRAASGGGACFVITLPSHHAPPTASSAFDASDL